MADEKTVAFSEVEKLIKENNEAMLTDATVILALNPVDMVRL